ncbi:MAG: hypothetical protein KC766_18180 [Myxococcales bacterium]|nr:hypothetical protein [Myxococcales bacterium]
MADTYSCILSPDRRTGRLNPRLKKAQFKISKTQAERELEETGAAEWFRAIAVHLNEQLSTSA